MVNNATNITSHLHSPKTTVMVNNATNITSHLHSPKTKRDHDLVMLEIQVPSWDRQRNVVG
jgi:hypothetical protein